MIPVADITAEYATLIAYVLVLAGVVLTAIGFRFGFKAAWKAVKAALGIASSAASGR